MIANVRLEQAEMLSAYIAVFIKLPVQSTVIFRLPSTDVFTEISFILAPSQVSCFGPFSALIVTPITRTSISKAVAASRTEYDSRPFQVVWTCCCVRVEKKDVHQEQKKAPSVVHVLMLYVSINGCLTRQQRTPFLHCFKKSSHVWIIPPNTFPRDFTFMSKLDTI